MSRSAPRISPEAFSYPLIIAERPQSRLIGFLQRKPRKRQFIAEACGIDDKGQKWCLFANKQAGVTTRIKLYEGQFKVDQRSHRLVLTNRRQQ
jgi:hypothetical protein